MEELIKKALGEGVTRKELFKVYVPKAHEMRKDLFARASEVPIIISFWFEDVDERYTCEFSPRGCEVEVGEMIDFPQATIVMQASDWDEVRGYLERYGLMLEKHREELEGRYVANDPMGEDIKDAFESLHGMIKVDVEGIKLKVILNDYEESKGDPCFAVDVTHRLIEDLIQGKVEPRHVAGQVKVKGQVSFAMDLAGFITRHFDM